MNRINLLPEHLLQAHAQSRRRRTLTLLLGGVALAISGWVTIAFVQVRQWDARIEQAEHELGPLRQRSERYEDLAKTRQKLLIEARLIETLREPISPPAILALLTQIVPPSLTLHELTLDIPKPLATTPSSRRQVRQHEPTDAILIELKGVAPAAAAVPTLVDRLMNSNVFQDIRLTENHQLVIDDQTFQKFQLLMRVPLTRYALFPEECLARE